MNGMSGLIVLTLITTSIESAWSMFSCQAKIRAGFYADPETQCNSFYQCRTDMGTFAQVQLQYTCSGGLLFNQLTLTCTDAGLVDCAR